MLAFVFMNLGPAQKHEEVAILDNRIDQNERIPNVFRIAGVRSTEQSVVSSSV